MDNDTKHGALTPEALAELKRYVDLGTVCFDGLHGALRKALGHIAALSALPGDVARDRKELDEFLQLTRVQGCNVGCACFLHAALDRLATAAARVPGLEAQLAVAREDVTTADRAMEAAVAREGEEARRRQAAESERDAARQEVETWVRDIVEPVRKALGLESTTNILPAVEGRTARVEELERALAETEQELLRVAAERDDAQEKHLHYEGLSREAEARATAAEDDAKDLLADLRRTVEVLNTGACVGECLTPQGDAAVVLARQVWLKSQPTPAPGHLDRQQGGKFTNVYPPEALCRCGHPFSGHSSQSPRVCLGPSEEGHIGAGQCPKGCERFRLAKAPKPTTALGLREAVGKVPSSDDVAAATHVPAYLVRTLRDVVRTKDGFMLRDDEAAHLCRALDVLAAYTAPATEPSNPHADQLRSLASDLPEGPDRDAVQSALAEPAASHAQLAAVVEEYVRETHEAEVAGAIYRDRRDDRCSGAREVLRRVTGGQVPPVAEWKAKAAKWDAAVGRAKDAGMLRRTAWAAFIGVSVCDEAVEADVRERGAEGALSGVAPAVTNYVLGLTLPTPEGPGATCVRCGHSCPSDAECSRCCSDPMRAGDTLCVDCDRADLAATDGATEAARRSERAHSGPLDALRAPRAPVGFRWKDATYRVLRVPRPPENHATTTPPGGGETLETPAHADTGRLLGSHPIRARIAPTPTPKHVEPVKLGTKPFRMEPDVAARAVERTHRTVTEAQSEPAAPVNLAARRIARDTPPDQVAEGTAFISYEGRPGACSEGCADFVLGSEVGILQARLEVKPEEWSGTYHAANVVMLERTAEAYGYTARVERSADPTWVFATFTPAAPARAPLTVVPAPEGPALVPLASGTEHGVVLVKPPAPVAPVQAPDAEDLADAREHAEQVAAPKCTCGTDGCTGCYPS